MTDLKLLQERIYANKVKQGFNTTNIPAEFCYIYEEVAEAYRAYRKELPDLGEELADIAIYLLGLSEMLKIDLEKEVMKKIEVNEKRKYKSVSSINNVRVEDGK